MKATDQQVRTNQKLTQGLSSLKQGTCVSINWVTGMAMVNVTGGTVPMPMAGTPPIPNAKCWIGFLGNQPICLGAVARPSLATVSGSPSGGIVRVTGDDGQSYMVAYNAALTPASPTRVLVDWASGGTILCAVSADPVTGTPVEVPIIGGGGTQSRVFNPVSSGTQNGSGNSGAGSFWTSQVYCGDTTLGGFFYGDQIAGTVPDGAHIVPGSVQVYVDALRTSGGSPSIGVHSLSGRAGVLTVDNPVTVAGGTGWKTLPDSFGDQLKTGARKGVGTRHGGYHIWSPAGSNNSGALRLSWT